MNKLAKTIIGIASAVTLLGVATFATVASTNQKLEKPVQVSANTNGLTGDTVFFVPSTTWKKDSATFKLKFYWGADQVENPEKYSIVEMTKVSLTTGKLVSNDIYYAVAPRDFTHLEFHRHSSSGEWWNKSAGFSVYDTGYNGSGYCVYMNQSFNWTDTWYPGCTGDIFWKEIKAAKALPSDYAASSSTGRVFLNNSGSDWASWSAGSTGVYVRGGNATQTVGTKKFNTIYFLNTFTDDNGTYYEYADIPTNASDFEFCVCNSQSYDEEVHHYQYGINPEGGGAYEVGGTFEVTAGCFAKVYYATSKASEPQYVSISVGGTHDNETGANFMTKVLEAYDTCSSSALNGYGAYGNLYEYFYYNSAEDKYKVTEAVKSTLCRSLGGGSDYTVSEHMEAMASRFALGSSRISLLPTASANDSTGAIVIVSTIAVAATAGFFFIRRKRA